MTDEQLIKLVALEELLDRHIQRCRDAVSACPKWSPAQAEWSRARDALLNFRDDCSALPSTQADDEVREALVSDAYKRGWDDACNTVEENQMGDPYLRRHKDTKSEGVGTYINVVHAALAKVKPNE